MGQMTHERLDKILVMAFCVPASAFILGMMSYILTTKYDEKVPIAPNKYVEIQERTVTTVTYSGEDKAINSCTFHYVDNIDFRTHEPIIPITVNRKAPETSAPDLEGKYAGLKDLTLEQINGTGEYMELSLVEERGHGLGFIPAKTQSTDVKLPKGMRYDGMNHFWEPWYTYGSAKGAISEKEYLAKQKAK